MLAQCMDNPEIIVEAKNKRQLNVKLKEIITGYVEAFPETKNDFFTNKKMREVSFIEY